MFRLIPFIFALLLATPLHAGPMRILAFGDSLTAGLGLAAGDAFPAQLEAALKAGGHDVIVVDGGVSGDTASAGRDRLDWTLGDKVDAVIVELGANDALRGLDPKDTKAALSDILTALRARKLPTLLAGMRAPRNLGPDYDASFDAIYPDLARSYSVLFYPFFLEGVAAEPSLNQPDGMHPTAEGVGIIVSRILPLAEELIARAAQK